MNRLILISSYMQVDWANGPGQHQRQRFGGFQAFHDSKRQKHLFMGPRRGYNRF